MRRFGCKGLRADAGEGGGIRWARWMRAPRCRAGLSTRAGGGVRWARWAMALSMALGLGMALGACGCAYSGGESGGYRWKSLYRQDVSTVAAPIFVNRSFNQGIEFKLTKALVGQIESATPYKVVGRERADTILEGEIVAAGVNPVSRDTRTSIPQEQLVTLRVNFIWKDLRTGRILVQQKDFEQATTYYPTLGEGQFVGDQLAAERLAVGIVQSLQAPW